MTSAPFGGKANTGVERFQPFQDQGLETGGKPLFFQWPVFFLPKRDRPSVPAPIFPQRNDRMSANFTHVING